ncbi:MAG: UDP-N-acetylmuramoyl-L-alanyl-D-glutamate--2,6-diaminopimelate ligase [Terriglobales bacterium]
MRIEDLLRGVAVERLAGALPAAVTGLHYDSRRIEPGWAFVAIRGEQTDGNNFVAAARLRGATLIVSERPSIPGVPWAQVKQARQALATAAANWFERPAERLRLVGITGTNGKTTTAWLIEHLLQQAHWGVGMLGTIEYHINSNVLPSPHTTPESYDLHRLLATMVELNCRAAVMEVSSHALALDRVWGCRFEVAVFTNLTQDHLDFHQSMAAYSAAKLRLFQGWGAAAPSWAVVNGDDAASQAMLEGFKGQVLRYGFGEGLEITGSELEQGPRGLRLRVRLPDGYKHLLASPMLGRVNALNLMAAVGAGLALGVEGGRAVAGAETLTRVPGRFEKVWCGQPFSVVVDYAHTPDALAKVLSLARELAAGRVLLVFGCGGDRDRGKRPLMGQAAQAGADWVLVTSDNPRGEDPGAIIAEILTGAPRGGMATQPDRAQAIWEAVAEARAGDVVVIAGKGHENYQIVGAERRPFSDVGQVQAALAARGWTE